MNLGITKLAKDRWENEGGKIIPFGKKGDALVTFAGIRSLEPQSAAISLPPFDHKEPADDDCGLPKHPIYANYSKYLWTSHKRSGGKQIVNYHSEPELRSGKEE